MATLGHNIQFYKQFCLMQTANTQQQQLREIIETSNQVIVRNLCGISDYDFNLFVEGTKAHGKQSWKRLSPEEAQLQFNSHSSAELYVWEKNFRDEVYGRPLNCHLNVNVPEKYIHGLVISGVTEKSLRAVFEALKDMGIYKIDFLIEEEADWGYAYAYYISTQELDEVCFHWASIKLAIYGMPINPWVNPQVLKYSVAFIKFMPLKPVGAKFSSQQARDVVWRIIMKLGLKWNCCPMVEVRSIDQQNVEEEFVSHSSGIYAYMSCSSDQKTLAFLDALKQYLKDHEQIPGKVILNNKQKWVVNSYNILFTKHILKQGVSMRQMEQNILKGVRLISKELLFVELEESKMQYTYHAKLFFSSEAAGKQFMAEYAFHLPKIEQLYSRYAKVEFQMFVDKEYKLEIEAELKEASRKQREEKEKKERETARMRNEGNQPMIQEYPLAPYFQPLPLYLPYPQHLPPLGAIPPNPQHLPPFGSK